MTDEPPIPVLVSVHDAMPETLSQVLQVFALLDARAVASVTLLVVPGGSWTAAGIEALRALQARGVVLAGHGWNHQVERIKGLKHYYHSLFLSRSAGEHLALDEKAIAALIVRCHAWFQKHGLGSPALYVPPAWAMGRLPWERLRSLPFRYYEVLGGVYDARSHRFIRLPLVGYEANSLGRVPFLRLWNALNVRCVRPNAPLRVAIHPRDLRMKLSQDLLRLLERPLECRAYASL